MSTGKGWTAALVGIALGLACVGASAQEKKSTAAVTGIDKIHAQARVGGKVCMVDHEHYGEGNLPSKRGAEAAAVRAWESFTAWEYGSAWGRYSLAVAKKMSCSASGAAWTCQTTARPCRTGR
jgi:hypothetical protein